MKKTLFISSILCCLAQVVWAVAQPWDPAQAVHRANEHVDTWSAIYTVTGEWVIDTPGQSTFLYSDVVQIGCYKYEQDTHATTSLTIRSDAMTGNGLFIGGKGYTGNKDQAGFLNDKPANEGIVIVENGASLTVGTQTTNGLGAQINVAQGADGRGSLIVDGEGTLVRSNCVLTIANNSGAEGSVKIDHGATLTIQGSEKLKTNNNSSLQLGNWQAENTTKAVLELDNGSTLNVLKPLSPVNPTATGPYVGIADSGEAELNAKNGSHVNFEGSAYVALYGGKTNSGSHGALNLESGSSMVAENLYVAYYGTGEVNISTGASLETSDFYLGWTNNATADIQSGATVHADYISVGNKSTATMDISGAGTSVNAAEIYVGDYKDGQGTVTVSDGAVVNARDFVVGCEGEGSLIATGAGTLINARAAYVSQAGGTGRMELASGAKLAADTLYVGQEGTFALKDGGELALKGNMALNGTMEIGNANLTVRENQVIATAEQEATNLVHIQQDGTLVNYGTMGAATGAEMNVQLEAGSRFQTGTMQVTGRGAKGDDNMPLNILGYDNGLTGAVSITLPAEGKLSLGSVLEGRNADNTGYELQKVYLGDYEGINDTLLKGLGLAADAATSGNIQFDYETRHIMLVLSTDEVNKHDGTHTVSVGEGSGVVIENGGRTEAKTKAGTIGSYSTDGSNTTQADVRVSEAASNTAGMQSVVEWHGSSLETISGESTTLTAGVTVTMVDKTVEGDSKKGTLLVKDGSTLTNDGVIHGITVVEKDALFKGSGTMGQTEVHGNLVVGNSPGVQTYNGNLTLYSSSSTTFSVAGLDNAATIGNTGWDSHTYSQITLGAGCTATLQDQASIIIEFGGTEIHALGGYHQKLPFSFDLLLISGNLLLPEGMVDLAGASGEIDITGHINATFTVTQDVAARYGNADNMEVNVLPGEYQFLVTKVADGTYKDLRLVGHGTVSVPEPATSTLSLLALAALAACRRRR